MIKMPLEMREFFARWMELTPEFIADMEAVLQPVELKRKECWLETGQVCTSALFIRKGIVYSSFENNGERSITWFTNEYDFAINVKSFFLQIPSEEAIVAVENVSGCALSYKDMQALMDKYPGFLKMYIRILEHYFILSETRAVNYRTKEAMKRYRYLLETHPAIIQRVPLKLIASFLNISVETLSRLRAKVGNS